MAVSTGELLVLSSQRKTCLTGVIKFRFFPFGGCMAALALFAVATEVYVVIGMTTVTVHRGIFFHDSVAMASTAR